MAPVFLPEQFRSGEALAAAQSEPLFTAAQLHLLRQQIDALRRINLQLRAFKYHARTGKSLHAAIPGRVVTAHDGQGGGRAGRPVGAAGRGGGAGRGRNRKRGREGSSEEDDSIVVHSGEQEDETAGSSSSSEDAGGLREEFESADSSESEEDCTLPCVDKPRRTGRVRRPSSAASALRELMGKEDSGSEEQGGEGRQQQTGSLAAIQAQHQQGCQAVKTEVNDVDSPEEGGPQASGFASQLPGNQAGTGSKHKKRRSLFMAVSDPAAPHAPLLLPELKPVVLTTGGEGATSDEDAVCSVCGDGDAVEGNFILLCEGGGCSVAVHQLCYGVKKVPAGKWRCDACKARLSPQAANCCVCPVVGGAVKRVAALGHVVPGGGAASAHCHLACALWVPEIELTDHERMAGVSLEKVTAARVRLRCECCKQGGGAVVQCAMDTCCRSFHVLCGRGAGQTLTFRFDGEPLAFCKLHSRPSFEKQVDDMVEGKQATLLPDAPAEESD